MKTHHYITEVKWPERSGDRTTGYNDYLRDHTGFVVDKNIDIPMSSDPHFKGDSKRYNPEELLVMSLSSCHMLWYLHLCAVNNIVVHLYEDRAQGIMEMDDSGSGKFTRVILHPEVQLSSGDATIAEELHEKAHELCFIARSVNFAVDCKPTITKA